VYHFSSAAGHGGVARKEKDTAAADGGGTPGGA